MKPDRSPHVASLRSAGTAIHRSIMALGLIAVVWLLLAGIAERTDIHADEHGYLLWAFLAALALAAWHRLAPPIIHLILDRLDR